MKEELDERGQKCERACLSRCCAEEQEDDKLPYHNREPWPNVSSTEKKRRYI